MNAKKELFIFADAQPELPEIDQWLSGEPAELYSIARHWFGEFRQCGDDVTEIMHDKCPTACVNNAAFGYVNVFKSHVNVGFFTGAYISDPNNLLEGDGKRMRHVKLRPGQAIDPEALGALIKKGYLDVKARMQ